MLSIEVLMANMSQSMEYATVCQDMAFLGGVLETLTVARWTCRVRGSWVAVTVQDIYRLFLLPKCWRRRPRYSRSSIEGQVVGP